MPAVCTSLHGASSSAPACSGENSSPFALRRKRAAISNGRPTRASPSGPDAPSDGSFGSTMTSRSFLHRVAHDDAGRSACVHAGDEHPSIPAVILHERLASFVSAAHPTPSFGEQLPLDRSERVRNVVRAGEAQHAAALVDPHVLSSFEPQRFVLEARRRTGAARFGRRPHRFVQHARPICLRERERQRAPRNERSHDRPSAPAATGAYRRPAHSSTPGL